MKKKRKEIGSENITSAELSQRVVEILASAAFRLATEGEKENANSTTSITPTQSEDFSIPMKRGRIPFGQKLSTEGLVTNGTEMLLIKRIQELAEQGCSSEKIARQLNKEDHQTKRAGRWTRTAVWRILKRLKEKGVTE